jgi:protein-disulfide isomerase
MWGCFLMSTGRIDRALSSITTLAVIAMAAVVVYHEIVPQTVPARARSNDGQMVFYDGWAKVGKTGRSLGDSLAQIQLIEFSDLECPFCKAFHEETEPAFEKRFGGRVNVIFVHLPIRGHRFALMAAQGAECAAKQGEFSNFVHTAFANQDSFGLKPWWVLAQASGIKDSLAFARCLGRSVRSSLIDSGTALAARLQIHSTPTVFMNGWRFPDPPSVEQLNRAAAAVVAGKKPTGRTVTTF